MAKSEHDNIEPDVLDTQQLQQEFNDLDSEAKEVSNADNAVDNAYNQYVANVSRKKEAARQQKAAMKELDKKKDQYDADNAAAEIFGQAIANGGQIIDIGSALELVDQDREIKMQAMKANADALKSQMDYAATTVAGAVTIALGDSDNFLDSVWQAIKDGKSGNIGQNSDAIKALAYGGFAVGASLIGGGALLQGFGSDTVENMLDENMSPVEAALVTGGNYLGLSFGNETDEDVEEKKIGGDEETVDDIEDEYNNNGYDDALKKEHKEEAPEKPIPGETTKTADASKDDVLQWSAGETEYNLEIMADIEQWIGNNPHVAKILTSEKVQSGLESLVSIVEKAPEGEAIAKGVEAIGSFAKLLAMRNDMDAVEEKSVPGSEGYSI